MSIICLLGNYLFKERYNGTTLAKATLQSDVLQPNDLGVRCLSFYWSMVQIYSYKLEVTVKSTSRFLVSEVGSLVHASLSYFFAHSLMFKAYRKLKEI